MWVKHTQKWIFYFWSSIDILVIIWFGWCKNNCSLTTFYQFPRKKYFNLILILWIFLSRKIHSGFSVIVKKKLHLFCNRCSALISTQFQKFSIKIASMPKNLYQAYSAKITIHSVFKISILPKKGSLYRWPSTLIDLFLLILPEKLHGDVLQLHW